MLHSRERVSSPRSGAFFELLFEYRVRSNANLRSRFPGRIRRSIPSHSFGGCGGYPDSPHDVGFFGISGAGSPGLPTRLVSSPGTLDGAARSAPQFW